MSRQMTDIDKPADMTDPCFGRLQRLAAELRRALRRKGIMSALVGLSGGPDSVLAFHLMRMATEGWPEFRLATAHANFLLRSEESLRDEEFVRRLLGRYPGVEAHFIRFDTLGYCSERNVSVEMGARDLRHGWFDRLRTERHYDRIVTGHNAGDNEETLLLNLLRGSGSRGLKGMSADNGRVLRPLLYLSRREITGMLRSLPAEHHSDPNYITDSTNLTDDYRRNFLRHKILPMLEERWPGARTSLQTTLRLMAEENRIVEHSVAHALEGCDDMLPTGVIRSFPSPLTLIRRWIDPYGGSARIASEMAEVMVPAEGDMQPGARWTLDGVEVTATQAGLRMAPITGVADAPQIDTEIIELTNDNRDSVMRDVTASDARTIYLPVDPEELEWRLPKPGERMKTGPGSSKLITRLLKEAGITAAMRDKIMLLAARGSGEAIWIPGIRRAYLLRASGTEPRLWRLTLHT